MKDQQIEKKPRIEVRNGITLTIDDSLKKYDAPEYKPEKLKKIKEQFSKGVIFK